MLALGRDAGVNYTGTEGSPLPIEFTATIYKVVSWPLRDESEATPVREVDWPTVVQELPLSCA